MAAEVNQEISDDAVALAEIVRQIGLYEMSYSDEMGLDATTTLALIANVLDALAADRCGNCGSKVGVAFRGWHDGGTPMKTCEACGEPDDR